MFSRIFGKGPKDTIPPQVVAQTPSSQIVVCGKIYLITQEDNVIYLADQLDPYNPIFALKIHGKGWGVFSIGTLNDWSPIPPRDTNISGDWMVIMSALSDPLGHILGRNTSAPSEIVDPGQSIILAGPRLKDGKVSKARGYHITAVGDDTFLTLIDKNEEENEASFVISDGKILTKSAAGDWTAEPDRGLAPHLAVDRMTLQSFLTDPFAHCFS